MSLFRFPVSLFLSMSLLQGKMRRILSPPPLSLKGMKWWWRAGIQGEKSRVLPSHSLYLRRERDGQSVRLQRENEMHVSFSPVSLPYHLKTWIKTRDRRRERDSSTRITEVTTWEKVKEVRTKRERGKGMFVVDEHRRTWRMYLELFFSWERIHLMMMVTKRRQKRSLQLMSVEGSLIPLSLPGITTCVIRSNEKGKGGR